MAVPGTPPDVQAEIDAMRRVQRAMDSLAELPPDTADAVRMWARRRYFPATLQVTVTTPETPAEP